jgi:hypothetical protein
MFMDNQNPINCKLVIKRLKIDIFCYSGGGRWGRRWRRGGRGRRCEKERKKERKMR